MWAGATGSRLQAQQFAKHNKNLNKILWNYLSKNINYKTVGKGEGKEETKRERETCFSLSCIRQLILYFHARQ